MCGLIIINFLTNTSPHVSCYNIFQVSFTPLNLNIFKLIVDRFFVWVLIKKTTQRRPNECQILYLGITIKLIDRSQRN